MVTESLTYLFRLRRKSLVRSDWLVTGTNQEESNAIGPSRSVRRDADILVFSPLVHRLPAKAS